MKLIEFLNRLFKDDGFLLIDAIMNISINNKKPVGNCILTCFNYKQALARKNKGKEAALALNSILYK